jgi:hypothetical protein
MTCERCTGRSESSAWRTRTTIHRITSGPSLLKGDSSSPTRPPTYATIDLWRSTRKRGLLSARRRRANCSRSCTEC